jgi:methyl-accepting chemotaxis protein
MFSFFLFLCDYTMSRVITMPHGYQQNAEQVADIPPDTSNRVALLLGTQVKKVPVLITFYFISLLIFIVGIADYATKGDIRYEIGALAAFIGGVLLGSAVWLVQNSPFDMVKILRQTLLTMQGLNRHLNNNVQALSATRHELEVLVHSLRTTNTSLEASAAKLTSETDRLNTANRTLELISQGAQNSLRQLAQGMADSNSKLSLFVTGLADELTAAKEAQGQFYTTLMELDTITQRNADLGAKLEHTSQQNTRLVEYLQEIAKKMESTQHITELRHLLRGIDELADGPTGLRATLAGPGPGIINENLKYSLLVLLEKIDQKLRDHIETMNHRTAEVRSCCLQTM